MPRFMLLLHGDADTETEQMPPKEVLDQMHAYNRTLTTAGILLDADGLHATSAGARVYFPAPPASNVNAPGPKDLIEVTKGPFKYPALPSSTQTRDHSIKFEGQRPVCGWWIIKVKDVDEAVEVAKKAPLAGCYVEVRRIAEGEDFPEELGMIDEENGWRKELAKKKVEEGK